MIGLGTVGRWLLAALDTQADSLAKTYGIRPVIVGAGRRRDGFVAGDVVAIAPLLDLLGRDDSLSELAGTDHLPDVDTGLDAVDAEVLVEVSASPLPDGEPGVGRMQRALSRGVSVVTSNKWPIALHGVELTRLAREHGALLRCESTVMSGTPVMSTLLDGLAGARPVAVRGVLNATANFVLTRIAAGASYEQALDAARAAGLAERDPSDDVEGRDSVAKAMVLAALVFDRQLRPEDVDRTGITDLDPEDVARAAAAGDAVRLVESIDSSPDGDLTARVRPETLPADDPLARVDGATCALQSRVDPLGEVLITGPGAGPELAGQGVLSDLIAVARALPD